MRARNDPDTASAAEFGHNVVITSICFEAAHITIRGRIVAGSPARLLLKALRSWFKFYRVQKWILDMTEVSRIDASGIGVLARAYDTATSKGAQFELINVPLHIQKMLEITGLDTLLLPAIKRSHLAIPPASTSTFRTHARRKAER